MRAGELCGLRVNDVEPVRNLICVQQSAWHEGIQTPKTENAVRTFAISPPLAGQIRSLLAKWRPNESGLLFATRKETPWDANLIVKRKLHPVLARLGIRRAGLHSFRRCNAMVMGRLGVPLKVRQVRLEHSDPKLTLGVYTHVASQDDTLIAPQLGDVFGGILDPNGPKSESKGPSRRITSVSARHFYFDVWRRGGIIFLQFSQLPGFCRFTRNTCIFCR
jgi:integrase